MYESKLWNLEGSWIRNRLLHFFLVIDVGTTFQDQRETLTNWGSFLLVRHYILLQSSVLILSDNANDNEVVIVEFCSSIFKYRLRGNLPKSQSLLLPSNEKKEKTSETVGGHSRAPLSPSDKVGVLEESKPEAGLNPPGDEGLRRTMTPATRSILSVTEVGRGVAFTRNPSRQAIIGDNLGYGTSYLEPDSYSAAAGGRRGKQKEQEHLLPIANYTGPA
ncbi:hypothetical protein K1719_012874 [Acacia pycnantha]|nr:hypothetical protein K1719_012874 [Acacia pycnantha]